MKVIPFDNIFDFMVSAVALTQSNLILNFKNVKAIYKNIFVCLLCVYNIVSLSRHDQVCLQLQSNTFS